MPLYQKVQKQLDRVLLKTRENLLGVRVVRAFNRQKDEMESFDQENAGLYRKQVFVGKISALLNPLTYIVNGYRSAIYEESWFFEHFYSSTYFWIFTVTLFCVGSLIFKRLKVHFADVL